MAAATGCGARAAAFLGAVRGAVFVVIGGGCEVTVFCGVRHMIVRVRRGNVLEDGMGRVCAAAAARAHGSARFGGFPGWHAMERSGSQAAT